MPDALNANTPKARDERRLFEASSPEIKALAADGRKRLRLDARRNFKRLKSNEQSDA